ncbi:MAG: type III-B CRISPR module RAMP protein Cmr6 [Bacteroidetes bacterium]|nr:type III-B CRISPR module RAMP protein Cmr6 [Bacteroidota bacterium]
MSAPNIGWKYYVDYFRAQTGRGEPTLETLDFRKAAEKNTAATVANKCVRISGYKLDDDFAPAIDLLRIPGLVEGQDSFRLTTTYPGLLVGSGYQHEVHVEGEFKLGFFFDYTSGLPVIPSSSVKGTLRSAFKAPEVMADVRPGIDTDDLKLIELEVFEGVDIRQTNKDSPDAFKVKKNWKYLPLRKRDIFHDAIIIDSLNQRKEFLASDFITPHKQKDRSKRDLDQFANPNPIQFLKVLSDVEFLFQFDLKKNNTLSKEEKFNLFKDIIKTLGVGAKTRTGYGWMEETPSTVQNAQNTH